MNDFKKMVDVGRRAMEDLEKISFNIRDGKYDPETCIKLSKPMTQWAKQGMIEMLDELRRDIKKDEND